MSLADSVCACSRKTAMPCRYLFSCCIRKAFRRLKTGGEKSEEMIQIPSCNCHPRFISHCLVMTEDVIYVAIFYDS